MRIGVLGAGQLGRMLALAGLPLGCDFRFLDPNPDSPARHTGELITAAYDDVDALKQFADSLDVATFEFENVPDAAAAYLSEHLTVFPPPGALQISQDRLTEKTFFQSIGASVPAFAAVDSWATLLDAVSRIGLPSVLKTRRFGYDGKGQYVLQTTMDVENAWQALGSNPTILEGFIDFERELSMIAVRTSDKTIAVYPLVQNHHREGILRLSIAPAPGVSADIQAQAQAEAIAKSTLEALDYTGVLAIELFQAGGRLIVNEMAPRVHNSGHWTIEGAVCSQFENHIRAISGLPLGDTSARNHCAMVNIIGCEVNRAQILSLPDVHLHLYGKAPRPDRKIGHITVMANTPEELTERLEQLRSLREPGLF